MSYNVPAALWDNKITVWSIRMLFQLAVRSKRQSVVSLPSEIQAVQIHFELAANCWTQIYWRTAPGCFQTELQTKWILAWDAWRQLDVYCLPLGLWRVTCYTVFTPFQIYVQPSDTDVTGCWKCCVVLWPAWHLSQRLASPWSLPRARPVVCRLPSSRNKKVSFSTHVGVQVSEK